VRACVTGGGNSLLPAFRRLLVVAAVIDVKNVLIKIKTLKNVKNVTKIKHVCRSKKKTLPLLSVV